MDIEGLKHYRSQKPLAEWEPHHSDVILVDCRAVLARLATEVIEVGPDAEKIVAAIGSAVQSFNELDEKHGPFIMTIEREALAEELWQIADLAGIEYDDEEILSGRDW